MDPPDTTAAVRRTKDLCAAQHAQLLYLVACGAHAYGTATPESDLDIRGVFLPPWRGLVGTSRRMERICSSADDIVLHSLHKFVGLCLQGNPNILDWLFVPDDCVLVCEPAFRQDFRKWRAQFLSKRLHARFHGYARGHFQKMERGSTRDLGEKCKADIAEHGYSTKNAMHLIRLSRVGCEVLETGFYNVRRPDAEELLAIRRGEWTLEQVRAEGAALMRRMDEAVVRSELPEKPGDGDMDDRVVGLTLRLMRW